jgi:hypothetical protein
MTILAELLLRIKAQTVVRVKQTPLLIPMVVVVVVLRLLVPMQQQVQVVTGVTVFHHLLLVPQLLVAAVVVVVVSQKLELLTELVELVGVVTLEHRVSLEL